MAKEKKIDKLTPEQWDLLETYKERTINQALRTRPANRRSAENAFKHLYARIDRPVPPVYWFDSPMAAELCINDIMLQKRPDEEIPEVIAEGRWKTSEFFERDDLSFYWFLGGCWDSWIWNYYDFATKIGVEISKEQREQLDEWLAIECHVWYPFDAAIFVSEFPKTIKRDEDGRLHDENGKSLEYRDSWGFSSWHGTRIPDEWVSHTNDVDPTLALTWENIEQRRCLAEIIGWDAVISQLKAKILQTDDYGELLEVTLPDADGPDRFVRVRCATDRTFVIPVSPETKTALDAVAESYGVSATEYQQLEVRT